MDAALAHRPAGTAAPASQPARQSDGSGSTVSRPEGSGSGVPGSIVPGSEVSGSDGLGSDGRGRPVSGPGRQDPPVSDRAGAAESGGRGGVAFDALRARQCRWPLAGSGAAMRCCGARTRAAGAAYCATHHARATRPDPAVGQATPRPVAPPGPRPQETAVERTRRPLDPRDLSAGLPEGPVGPAARDFWG